MNQVYEQQIKELRLNGLGYKRISAITGVPVSTVRYFCKINNLTGTGAQLKLTYEEKGERRLYCKQCGEKLIRKSHCGKKLFCCEDCRRLWWKENGKDAAKPRRPRHETRCLHCGKSFVYYGSAQSRKYCSRDCYLNERFYKDMKPGTRKRPIRDIDSYRLKRT